MPNCYGDLSRKIATWVAATSQRFRERTAPNVLQTENEVVGFLVERKSTAVWRKRFILSTVYYYIITHAVRFQLEL